MGGRGRPAALLVLSTEKRAYRDSTGDFSGGAAALLGKDAPNLSAPVIGRLKEAWQAGYAP